MSFPLYDFGVFDKNAEKLRKHSEPIFHFFVDDVVLVHIHEPEEFALFGKFSHKMYRY
jgi:hypothetical protein